MKRRERERQATEGGPVPPRLATEVYGPPGKRWAVYGELQVPVTLFRDGQPLEPRVWGKVDTGAYFSVLPWAFSERLGLDPEEFDTDPYETLGAPGELLTARHVIEAEISGSRVELLGSFSRNPNLSQIILGTEDCLQHFKITMHMREGTCRLEPSELEPRPRPPR